MKRRAFGQIAALTGVWTLIAWTAEAWIPQPYTGYVSKTAMVLLALLGVKIGGGKFRAYGLSLQNVGPSLRWGVALSLAALLPPLIAVLALVVMGVVRPQGPSLASMGRGLVWYLAMVGLAEEIFFRGFVQSRLNEVYGRPYRRLLGFPVAYGPGLPIAAALFGAVHLVNGVNPLIGKFSPTLSLAAWVLLTAFVGLLLGMVREATGDVWACSLFHGLMVMGWSTLQEAVRGSSIGTAAFWAGTGLGFYALFARVLDPLFARKGQPA